jgi:Ca2+-binding RTX toxin-like protein
MIINQSGVSSPFTFAGTGDDYAVSGIVSNLDDPSMAVISAALAGNLVTSAGQISSFGAGSAINFAAGGAVVNSGLISGAVVSGDRLTYTNAATGRHVGFILVNQAAETLGSTITNRGVLAYAAAEGNAAHTAGAVITLADSADSVINSGRITGDILLGGGNDIFDGRGGAVLGTVNGGLGDDLYYLTQASTVIVDAGGYDTVNARASVTLAAGIEKLVISGWGNFSGIGNSLANLMIGNGSANLLDGGGNNDTLQGGNGADLLKGNTGNDSQEGQAGNDSLQGGYGNDTLLGGDNDDSLAGETGSDLLLGGLGLDRLDGGVGGDSLDGGEGADSLIGGAFGTDTLTGGLGADLFVYRAAQDSFATAAADVITDFTQGEDKIDLTTLVAGDLLFMAGGLFSEVQASLRCLVQTGKTLVQVDVNFDGTADMQVFLTGEMTLTADDFLL